MAKRKFWTPTKVIVTIFVSLFILFLLFSLIGKLFPLSVSNDALSQVVSGAVGGGGGTG